MRLSQKIILFFLIVAMIGCKTKFVPTLTTTSVNKITETSAISGGNVTDDGNTQIVSRGIVWSRTQQPTIETNMDLVESGSGLGLFEIEITGLEGNTQYFVRAFASNEIGTSYGNQQEFITLLVEKPTVVSLKASDITTTSALVGGNITHDGGTMITEQGIFWGTTINAETTGIKVTVESGAGIGTYSYQLNSLTANTIYFVKAFAINSKGISYGDEISFTTQNITTTDIDGNIYHTVTIDKQTWMVENLKTMKYNDGSSIPLITGNAEWGNMTTPGYCFYENDSSYNKANYGAIYNWYAVNTGKLCPSGWHVPTDAEWNTLTTFLGESIAGAKIKESGTLHWLLAPNNCATNETGFTALPGGYRVFDGSFESIGFYGRYWSSTQNQGYEPNAFFRTLTSAWCFIQRDDSTKRFGFSVRCLKD
jgi:uncharacterized protein (TIGR02145 family)